MVMTHHLPQRETGAGDQDKTLMEQGRQTLMGISPRSHTQSLLMCISHACMVMVVTNSACSGFFWDVNSCVCAHIGNFITFPVVMRPHGHNGGSVG